MALASTITVLHGCAPADDVMPIEGISLSVDPAATCTYCYEPPTGRNGLIPLEFWSDTSQSAMREIQYYPLAGSGSVTLPSGEVVPKLPTPPYTHALLINHPSVMKHLVQCALGETQAVYDTVNNAVYRGWWGLAKPWYTGDLAGNPNMQEWVTACMIARLNNLGVHVGILLEGAKPVIEVNSTYDPIFWFNESTVYGNMFASTKTISSTSPAFDAFLCREDSLVATCPGDGGQEWVDRRLCDNAPATCGLIDIGRCARPIPSGGHCMPNGEHWECEVLPGAVFTGQTIGVQLEVPLTSTECKN